MISLSIEPYPFGKRFAVTMTDDTDGATLAGIRPVYDCMIDHGIRITKTLWPFRQTTPSGSFPFEGFSAATLEDREYVAFCRRLQQLGFELALHTVSAGNNTRKRTIEGYDRFRSTLGVDPATNIMHRRNLENMYWGKDLLPWPLAQRCVALFEPQQFYGHVEGSEYYWGDICSDRTSYVRALQTLRTNTLAFDPALPYHDPDKPDVNWWFSASYGVGTRLFSLLDDKALENLRRDRGACIAYVYCMHYGMEDNGRIRINPRFENLARRLADADDGWYVPVRILLDRLRAVRGLFVAMDGNILTITNNGPFDVENLAIRFDACVDVQDGAGRNRALLANRLGQIPLGTVRRGERLRMTMKSWRREGEPIVHRPRLATTPNHAKLALGTIQRIAWQYGHGRRGRGNHSTPQRPAWIGTLSERG